MKLLATAVFITAIAILINSLALLMHLIEHPGM